MEINMKILNKLIFSFILLFCINGIAFINSDYSDYIYDGNYSFRNIRNEPYEPLYPSIDLLRTNNGVETHDQRVTSADNKEFTNALLFAIVCGVVGFWGYKYRNELKYLFRQLNSKVCKFMPKITTRLIIEKNINF